MARMGLFGRRTDDDREAPAAVGSAKVADRADRDGDGVPDRAETREERLVDRNGDTAVYRSNTTDRDADTTRAAHERTEARLAARERAAQETAVVDRDRDGVDDRVQAPPAPVVRARSSMLATLALIVGMTSVYAALTGRLAPVAVALGVLGLLLSFGGLSASGRPRVAGGGMALLALLLSVAGAVLGVLAITGSVSWLDSDVDQVAKLRDWLDSRLPFMKGW